MPTNKRDLAPATRRWPAALEWILAGVVVGLWALHWFHLRADFPNGSPWMDYAKYTDEGWYGNAAIRSILFGHWFLWGDFNPAVALPVWPALEWLVFHLTGVSLSAARGLALVIFGADLVLSYLVIRAAGGSRAARWGGVLLLNGSMFYWCFSRLAILEPLLVFSTLLSWLLALQLPRWARPRQTAALLAIGFLGCIGVLTKTTALFLFPATAVLLAAGHGWRLRRVIADLVIATAGGLGPWAAYYLVCVRPHYRGDFFYLFAANRWDAPHGVHDQLLAFWWAAHGVLWVGPCLVCLALALLLGGLVLDRGFRRNPLVYASLVAAAGYIFFIGWHNSPQPRYYMVLGYPVVFVAMLGADALARRSRTAGGIVGVALAAVLGWNAYRSVSFATHPQYTLLSAADGLTAYIRMHEGKTNPLLLSISGDQISLMTHQPAICSDYGSIDLSERILHYQPGWFAEWNEVDPGTLEDIHTAGYQLQAVAHWHALDDEDRNDLILYRMVRVAPGQHPRDTLQTQ